MLVNCSPMLSVSPHSLNAESQAEIRKLIEQQLGITQQNFAPFLQSGQNALSGLTQSSTLGGMDNTISQILGGDHFQSLIGERQRALQGQLSAGGLTRSGTALESASALPTDLAFQLENQLFGRQNNLAQTGLNAAAQTGSQESGLLQGIINAITQGTMAQGQGITGSANATASGLLGGAQSQASGIQNLLNLGGTLGSAAILRK